MCPEDDMPLTDEDKKKAIESFLEVYTSIYRDYLGKKDVDERHLPLVYKGFPFVVEAYLHPNQGVSVILKKSNRSRILVVEGEFEEVRSMLSERNFDFMQTFPPYTQWTEDEAERISKLDADRDLAGSRRLELLGGIEIHMDDIMKESDSILQLNPWLDEQSKAQAEKVEKARALILELYREMETDENERFARYERELMEIEAFEKMEIEAVASEMEVEVETAVSEIEEQFGELEGGFEELEGEFKELGGEFEELRDALNDSIDNQRKKLAEALLKIDNIESTAESDDLLDDMKELRDANRKMNTTVRKSEKEIRDLKKNLTISEEIKDTVFRDSKRIHNLNERTTDLESEVQKMASSKPKKVEDEIKALGKRFDKLDKNMNKMIKKAVDFEFETRKPIVIETPPPPSSDSAPKGATIKKTTKKKTTKKTKKKAS